MPCHRASPATGGPYPGVIVVMEAFELNGHIKALTERIAREGYVAIAPDLYHRFGSPVVPYEDEPAAITHMKRLDPERVMAEIGVVIAHLQSRPEAPTRVGIVGFCMGGTVALRTAAYHGAAVAAVVSFYGGGSVAADAALLARIASPVLALFAERDAFIPLEQVERIDATMRRLGKTYESKVYLGAVHGFFCDERESYDSGAARDSWMRLLGWLSKHLK